VVLLVSAETWVALFCGNAMVVVLIAEEFLTNVLLLGEKLL
jgi:hypothetical protein